MVRHQLSAGLIDMCHFEQLPLMLGCGSRFWDGLKGLEERHDLQAVSSPSGVTHLTFTRK